MDGNNMVKKFLRILIMKKKKSSSSKKNTKHHLRKFFIFICTLVIAGFLMGTPVSALNPATTQIISSSSTSTASAGSGKYFAIINPTTKKASFEPAENKDKLLDTMAKETKEYKAAKTDADKKTALEAQRGKLENELSIQPIDPEIGR